MEVKVKDRVITHHRTDCLNLLTVAFMSRGYWSEEVKEINDKYQKILGYDTWKKIHDVALVCSLI